eukprot:scaffold70166_cov59-Attheya_sp.AAC.9
MPEDGRSCQEEEGHTPTRARQGGVRAHNRRKVSQSILRRTLHLGETPSARNEPILFTLCPAM